MKEQSALQTAIGAVVIIGVLFLVSRLYNRTYTPLDNKPSASHLARPAGTAQLPLACAIVVSDTMEKSGSEIRSLDVALVRPVGEMLSGFLSAEARDNCRTAKIAGNTASAQDCDIIIELESWSFGKDTGYSFTGLPILVASGEAFTTLSATIKASGRDIPTFIVSESAKGTRQLSLALFPASRLILSMTESADLAAASVSKKLLDEVVRKASAK